MAGIDLDALTTEYPVVAVAKKQVESIRAAAKALCEMREDSKLSQTDMALRLGVSKGRIVALESGKPDDAPTLANIVGYSEVCRKPFSLINRPVEQPTPEPPRPAAAVAPSRTLLLGPL
jgi:DNA-binding XRE family transcriptional regulator